MVTEAFLVAAVTAVSTEVCPVTATTTVRRMTGTTKSDPAFFAFSRRTVYADFDIAIKPPTRSSTFLY
jgi:hypothetical protein